MLAPIAMIVGWMIADDSFCISLLEVFSVL